MEQMNQEKYEKLQEEIKHIYEEELTDEQFKRFAFDWVGMEAMVDYLDCNIEAETNISTLEEWLKDAKSYLNSGTADKTTDGN